jgi:hypothetical protein
MSQKKLWASYTGTIIRKETETNDYGPFMKLTIECGTGEDAFRKDCYTGRAEAIEVLEAMNVGDRVFLRGPQQWSTKTIANGSSIRFSTLRVIYAEPKPLEAANASDEVADERPALPEGATEITHQLYTKKDGELAWRKRPAKQVAKLMAAAAEAGETTEVAAAPAPEVAFEPAPVKSDVEPAGVVAEAKAEAKTSVGLPDVEGEETAMAAALRAAMAG